MPYQITRFETTPNPNAIKFWLDRSISDCPRSFLNQHMAADDPIAAALFAAGGGVTNVLFNGQWMTVNKTPDAEWPAVKKLVGQVLAEVEAGER